jgi:D-alanine-D-alanine ligase
VRIGLTYTLRRPPARDRGILRPDALPDDEEEFDSPDTIDAIADALQSFDHEVELMGDGHELAQRLLQRPLPELVFNIAEGRGISRSREAWIPALLEMFGVPYTGSDPLALAATLDKDVARRLVNHAGVAVPAALLVDGRIEQHEDDLQKLPLPAIVKPAIEGSGKGILEDSIVHKRDKLPDIIERRRQQYQQPVLVEEFIDGEEITVGILGNQPPVAIGSMGILPIEQNGPFVYGLEIKRHWRQRVRYEVPARLSQPVLDGVERAALTAFRALGCRDVARMDFRIRAGVPYFLEANPLPGLAPGAGDLVLLAAGMGIEYRELIGRILNAATERLSQSGALAGIA